jgi:hypothetical protein
LNLTNQSVDADAYKYVEMRGVGVIPAEPDISFFDAVPTQMLPDDRRSILTVQQIAAARLGRYAYLEIGSYLGGSLQPHLRDDRCVAAYSIDPRPRLQPDERGEDFQYQYITTQHMLDALAPAYGAFLGKLTSFERDVADIKSEEFPIRPQMCLIDGEHTDRAVFSDFRACLRIADRPCVITFDDAHIVYRGFAACVRDLQERGEVHRAYILPNRIGVIEIGELYLYREPAIFDRIARPDAYLYATGELDYYRRLVMTIKNFPVVRLARRVRNAMMTRRGAMGGEPLR